MELPLIIGIVLPIIVVAFGKILWPDKVTFFEATIAGILVIAMVSIFWATGRFAGAGDTELLNGQVTGKTIKREYCPSGWRDTMDDFCTEYSTRRVKDGPPRKVCSTTGTGDNKRKSCHYVQDYKTQYNYNYPWEQKFFVYTNLNTTFKIDRVDRQGAYTPPLYAQTYISQPASVPHYYDNWIKAASNNIFHQDGKVEEKYKAIMPDYPNFIYDKFKVDRTVRVGNVNAPIAAINQRISEVLRELGPKLQMNLIIVLVDTKVAGDDFPYALRRYWQGFKKNDAVVFIGINPDGTLAWNEVMSWSKKSIFDIQLRDSINQNIKKPVNFVEIVDTVHEIAMKSYERREMADFEYLKKEIPVPTWLTILIFVLSIGGSVGLVYVFFHVDFNPFEPLFSKKVKL
jgi:hypothetical protein